MLTIKQSIDNAYVIATVMKKCKTFRSAKQSINDICDLDVTEHDLRQLINMRVNNFNFDKIFLVWE